MNFLKKNIIYLLITAALLSIFLVPSIKNTIRERFFPVAEIESAVYFAPEDLNVELQGINTSDTNLKSLLSKKVVFLNFWGSWCPPCRAEWPSIEALYRTKKEQVSFALIAMEDEESAVRDFIKKNKYTAPVYIAKSPISNKMLPNVYPTTYLLDNTGRILKKEGGSRDWNSSDSQSFISSFLK